MAFQTPYVDYQCRSCRQRCLIPHAHEAAKYHECRDCYAVPVLERDRLDYRNTSLLWAMAAAPLDLQGSETDVERGDPAGRRQPVQP